MRPSDHYKHPQKIVSHPQLSSSGGRVLIDEAMPDLVASFPERYDGMSLRQLCDEIHIEVKMRGTIELLDRAFNETPTPHLTPSDAYRRLVRGQSELVPVSAMAERVVSVMVVPYPPGIPVLMPGESAGPSDGPMLQYHSALQEFDKKFPGFAHDIHGVSATRTARF